MRNLKIYFHGHCVTVTISQGICIRQAFKNLYLGSFSIIKSFSVMFYLTHIKTHFTRYLKNKRNREGYLLVSVIYNFVKTKNPIPLNNPYYILF